MLAKNILSVTEARKNIFTLVEKVEKRGTSFILTERVRAKAALIPINVFDRQIAKAEKRAKEVSFSQGAVMWNFSAPAQLLRDGCQKGYQRGFLDPWEEEKAYARSILYVKLVEEFGFTPKQIEIGYPVELMSKEGKQHMEIDLIATNKAGQPCILFMIMPLKIAPAEQEKLVALLYTLAETLGMNEELSWLVGFAYGCKEKVKESQVFVIDYRKYPSLLHWQKGGKKKREQLEF